MNIVHVASEMFPYIKTGGLADVVGALARELARRGHQVTVFLPGYRKVLEYADQAELVTRGQRLRIEMGDRFMSGDVRAFTPEPNLKVYLICREEFFDRKLPYGNGERDYEDNHLRFIFFCKAVVEVMRRSELAADVVHTHDWPAGLLPLLLRVEEQRRAVNLAARTVHTIHNIAFQGLFPMRSFYHTNLPDELAGVDGLEYYGQASMMKAGLNFADRITTVSPNYAREIQTSEFGCGLDGVVQLRADDLVGMINGIDTDEWNPRTDPLIPGYYSVEDLGGKSLCRAKLLETHGFDPLFTGPVFGMACRLTEQKGVQLLLANEERLAASNLKLIVIGTGDVDLEDKMREFAAKLPEKVSYHATIGESAGHLLESGSDFFLMPSLFEPCGLNQMYAQIYGTIPLVTAVGGLVDTVTDALADGTSGTGIVTAPDAAGVAEGIQRAMALWSEPEAYRAVQARGMGQDFGWNKAVNAYEAYYLDIV